MCTKLPIISVYSVIVLVAHSTIISIIYSVIITGMSHQVFCMWILIWVKP